MQHIALGLLLREHGVFDVHAATACTGDRAMVILGDSGAGKTSLLLCLMALGCTFLGDDRLLFRTDGRRAELLAYPREFHLSPITVKLVPEARPEFLSGPSADGKYAIRPLDVWSDRFRRSWTGPITLILPRIEAVTESRVERASSAEAFGRLLSSSASVVVDAIGRRGEQLESLRVLANSAEAYSVALGADLLADPRGTARSLLDKIEASRSKR